MPKTSTRTKSSKISNIDKDKVSPSINSYLRKEITRLSTEYGINTVILDAFAHFVVENHKKKEPKVKPLTLAQVKSSIFKYFSVENIGDLKKSGAFKMATDGMGKLNFSLKKDLEKIYRELIGVLPGEEQEEGYGCINGVNIFKYDRPWQIFKLDPQKSSLEDIKVAYRNLSKIYHPDIKETGDAAIFDRLNILYKSIATEV